MKQFAYIFIACLALLIAPAHAAAGNTVLLNPGFEEPLDTSGSRLGWQLSQHAGVPAYEMGFDKQVFSEGKQSYKIKRVVYQVFGQVSQKIRAPKAIGKTLEYSAMLRTQDVGELGWMLVVDFLDIEGYLVKQIRSKPLTGTTKWQRVGVKHTVPPRTFKINVGATLLDAGTGWIDDAKISIGEAPPAAKPGGESKVERDAPGVKKTPIGKPTIPN